MIRVLAVLVLAALAGCGYTAGLRVADHHESVAIELFGNDSFERDLEPLVHDEMTRVLREQSDARLVDPREAQAFVRGTIGSYNHRSGIRSTDNKLLETGVYIEVHAQLFKRGNETPLRSAQAAVWVGYTVDRYQNERLARDQAIRHLAEEIVLELFGPSDEG